MTETIEAVYENGVLRLLQPTLLHESQRVRLTLNLDTEFDDLFDTDFMNEAVSDADKSITLEEVRMALSSISGSMDVDCSSARDERF